MTGEEFRSAENAIRAFVFERVRQLSNSNGLEELFHYTTPSGLVSIVNNRALWASDMLSLNDTSEMKYPQQLMLEASRATGLVPLALRQRFETQLAEFMFRIDAPYVTCICEYLDLLSQWRGYGAGGEGFAVGFGVPWLESLASGEGGWRLLRVIYKYGEQCDHVAEFIDDNVARLISERARSEEEESRLWQNAASALSFWVITFKHRMFSEENEWRIVSQIERRRTCFKTSFRYSGRRIVPFGGALHCRIPL